MLRGRYGEMLPSAAVRECVMMGALALAIRKCKLPFSWMRWAMRAGDARIGSRAGRLASRRRSALLSYSYYGYSAFQTATAGVPRILFQLHPHPVTVRRILTRELQRFPECATSLLKEWELALPESDFRKLVEETGMAQHWIVASSFTRATLIDNGAPEERVFVAPYGINLERFRVKQNSEWHNSGTLKLLFVGTINQRKGIRYLLEALDLVKTKQVQLVVCGRVVDDLEIFKAYAGRVDIRPSVSRNELIAAYHECDLFIFPSLAEGFGHVLLEAMACGLPIVSTTRTAAVDLVKPASEGFIVEPCRADLLAERIDWALSHRRDLAFMGLAARARAETFTWARFRERIRDILDEILCAHCGHTAEAVSLHV
ncbi:MAG: glycosyltransferase family 4 protein [Bryobacteraceae bacterium]